jgi:hypothetical protein
MTLIGFKQLKIQDYGTRHSEKCLYVRWGLNFWSKICGGNFVRKIWRTKLSFVTSIPSSWPTGWPDWANFRQLGNFWKLQKEPNFLRYHFPLGKLYWASCVLTFTKKRFGLTFGLNFGRFLRTHLVTMLTSVTFFKVGWTNRIWNRLTTKCFRTLHQSWHRRTDGPGLPDGTYIFKPKIRIWVIF